MAERDLATSDHRRNGLGWREVGNGDPVLFLHGLGGTRTSWEPQLNALSSRFRCIAWDMPGYGVSDPIEPLTYRAIAERIVELLDLLRLDRVDLVGLSFGGMHALHAALVAPERFGRLVLAGTSPAFGMDGTTRDRWVQSRLSPLTDGATPADMAEAVIDSITAETLTDPIRRQTVEAFARIPATGFRAAVECLPDNDVRADLHRIRHRACVIVGEFDAETPPSYSEILANGLPNAELHIITGAGHLTPAERPGHFNQLVERFLARPGN